MLGGLRSSVFCNRRRHAHQAYQRLTSIQYVDVFMFFRSRVWSGSESDQIRFDTHGTGLTLVDLSKGYVIFFQPRQYVTVEIRSIRRIGAYHMSDLHFVGRCACCIFCGRAMPDCRLAHLHCGQCSLHV